jgi:histidine triad (HIT) family protein
MTECEFCTLIKGKMNKIYEDDQIFVMHAPKPATFGHVLVLPKKHVMILEQIPDYEVADIFSKVNKISTAVFESLGAHGTNIILQNGVAAGQNHSHLMIHVIPRREGDGIDFTWQPKQLSEEEMSTVELKLKELTKNIGAFEEKPAEPVEMDKEVEQIKEPEGEEENYLIKQLQRIP